MDEVQMMELDEGLPFKGVVCRVSHEGTSVHTPALIDSAQLPNYHVTDPTDPAFLVGDVVEFSCVLQDGRWVINLMRKVKKIPTGLLLETALVNTRRFIDAASPEGFLAYGNQRPYDGSFGVTVVRGDRKVDVIISASTDWKALLRRVKEKLG